MYQHLATPPYSPASYLSWHLWPCQMKITLNPSHKTCIWNISIKEILEKRKEKRDSNKRISENSIKIINRYWIVFQNKLSENESY